ncbi:MAG: phosphoribosylglycinamide formyltransferase [Chitinophagaceae bacterium]|nr:phosphoribosylglycinamide formyltransferase [Chitinophagaceae bacterium]
MGIKVGESELSAVSYQLSANSNQQSGADNFKSQISNPKSQISNLKSTPARLAVFASGTGSNAQKIIDFFRNDPLVAIALIVSNKPTAGVLQIAEREKIASLVIEKEKFFNGDGYVEELKKHNVEWIILAGFLWKVPVSLIQAFPGKIINIHPALLPKYGGKGMYGHFVHEAVITAGEKQSGITIHFVDELFDHGAHIFQAYCNIEPGETPETLAKKVQVLEHKHFPEVIKQLVGKV